MLRYIVFIGALMSMGATGMGPVFAQEAVQDIGSVRVGLDRTRLVRMPEPIGGIAVGNSDVVGVALHDVQTVILTGRAPGLTNILLMDTSGRVMQEASIHVPVGHYDGLTITRRNRTSTYVCDKASCQARKGQN